MIVRTMIVVCVKMYRRIIVAINVQRFAASLQFKLEEWRRCRRTSSIVLNSFLSLPNPEVTSPLIFGVSSVFSLSLYFYLPLSIFLLHSLSWRKENAPFPEFGVHDVLRHAQRVTGSLKIRISRFFKMWVLSSLKFGLLKFSKILILRFPENSYSEV